MVPKIPQNSGSTPTLCFDKAVLVQGGGGVCSNVRQFIMNGHRPVLQQYSHDSCPWHPTGGWWGRGMNPSKTAPTAQFTRTCSKPIVQFQCPAAGTDQLLCADSTYPPTDRQGRGPKQIRRAQDGHNTSWHVIPCGKQGRGGGLRYEGSCTKDGPKMLFLSQEITLSREEFVD